MRNDWTQVKQNSPFPCHNTENRIKTSNFFKLFFLEDITSNNNENPDFKVTPSAQANILTSTLRPNFMPAQYHIVLISQQYLETVPNLERKFFPNFSTSRELNVLILKKNCAMVKPF